jgi:GNAT superfamily N-acetyltransferase
MVLEKRPTEDDQGTVLVWPTLSGARLASIDPAQAGRFLAHLGERAPTSLDTAFGAFEDNGALIGVGTLEAPKCAVVLATVAIRPERRRLKVGTDLLHLLMRHARTIGASYLVFGPAEATAIEAIARSLGLITARRVCHGTVTTVVVVLGDSS